MHVYRFRVLLEDADDFYREIEIQASSTFEDLHKIILQSVNFDGKELASFYISDGKWNRKKEICLADMSDSESNEEAPLLMKKCKLAEFIDDPHQRLTYVYDFLNLYEFYIELSKIIPSEKGVKYPRCSKQAGIVPKVGAMLPPRSGPVFDDEDGLTDYPEVNSDIKEEENADALFFSDAESSSGIGEEAGDRLEDE